MNMTRRGHLIARILVAGFLLLAFGAAVSATSKRILSFHETGLVLTREIFEMEALLSSRELWEERSRWLRQNAPRFASEEEAARHLTEALANSAHQYKLTVQSREVELPQAIVTPPDWSNETSSVFDHALAGIAVSGEERAIVKWIHHIQSPEKFRGIDRVSIEANKDGLFCEVQVSQWYLDLWRPALD